jgi:hypothetical protein
VTQRTPAPRPAAALSRALERRGEGGGGVLAGVCLPAHPCQLAQPSAAGQPGDGDDRARLQLEVDVPQDRRSSAVALDDLCELDQNAPRRERTAGMVLTRIDKSRNTDQRSR